MINFVNGSPDRTYAYHEPHTHTSGALAQPCSMNDMRIAANLGMPWALDNGCFLIYDPDAILKMLARFQGVPGCKFCVVPDVVGNHDETLLLFRAWLGTYQCFGYPPAFVLQNGVSVDTVPWDSIAAVFIGGDTPFKYSAVVRQIVTEAKRRGKWVHMGRVNSMTRIRYAASIGCDSFDGSGFSMIPGKIASHLAYYTGGRQMNIWESMEMEGE